MGFGDGEGAASDSTQREKRVTMPRHPAEGDSDQAKSLVLRASSTGSPAWRAAGRLSDTGIMELGSRETRKGTDFALYCRTIPVIVLDSPSKIG